MEAVQTIEGIKCYAPDLAMENSDFPPDQFATIFEGEQKNFWFRSRNRILCRALKRITPEKNVRFMEIGCGTGYVLSGIHEKFPGMQLTGSEIYISGLKFAASRVPSGEFIQLDATRMPFDSQFDFVGAFDVLEHIDEDEKVMSEVHKALIPGGSFLITVPQHMWLWSSIDEYSCHKRRYTRKEMLSKLKKAGFDIHYVSSFMFSLLPLMYLSRLRRKNKSASELTKEEINSELLLSPMMNFILGTFMRIDEFLLWMGLSLPAGGSLFVIAKKH